MGRLSRRSLLRCAVFAVVLAPVAGTSAPAVAEEVVPGFEARIYQDTNGKALPYRLMLPKDYDPKQRYPLVLFLHGAGERGTDNEAQVRHASRLPWATPANREKYPCFVVAPQCPVDDKWTGVENWNTPVYRQPEKPTEALRLALELVSAVQREFSVDSARLYASGLSMGGYGTWELLNRQPGLFAAAVPVCGGADETLAERVRIPVWTFHGEKDGVVLPIQTRRMVEALRKAGGNVRYTEYPEVGHNSWDRAFAEPELLPWLFSQRKK